jgi:hypothetical protein
MCTMDYVTHILTLQGWERARCLEDYFAGWEEDEEDEENEMSGDVNCGDDYCPQKENKGCQTPRSWLDAPKPKEAEQGRARCRTDREDPLDRYDQPFRTGLPCEPSVRFCGPPESPLRADACLAGVKRKEPKNGSDPLV